MAARGNPNLVAGPGRPKGSITRPRIKSTHQEFIDELCRLNFDPLREAIALYRDPDMHLRDRVILIKDIMSYTYSRVRSVEVAGDVQHNTLNINWNGGETASVPADATFTLDADDDTDTETDGGR